MALGLGYSVGKKLPVSRSSAPTGQRWLASPGDLPLLQQGYERSNLGK